MKVGSIIYDDHGNQYVIRTLLGRGLSCKTFVVGLQRPDQIDKDPSKRHLRGLAERHAVLKTPLAPSDFSGGNEYLSEICREAFLEKYKLLPPSVDVILQPTRQFTTEDGTPCAIFNQYTNFTQFYRSNVDLSELLSVIIQVVDATESIPLSFPCHGNLHPNNIFISDSKIVIDDPITHHIASHYEALLQEKIQSSSLDSSFYITPEVKNHTSQAPNQITSDTYALSACLLQALTHRNTALHNKIIEQRDEVFNRDIKQMLRDLVFEKLKNEESNSHFHERFVQEILLLLTRSLSRSFQPSPPYRFHKYNTYRERVSSLFYLLKPSITKVSSLFLEFRPGLSHFYSDEEVKVFTSIESIPVIDDHEVISTLIRVIDLRTNEKISISSSYSVDFHPSNRLRYSFLIQPLPPSNYKISLAFGVSGSSYSYIFVEADFSVFPRETLYNETQSGPTEQHSTEHFSNEVISAESRFQENASKEIPIIVNNSSVDSSNPLPRPLSLSEPQIISQDDSSQRIEKSTQGSNQSTVTDLPTWNDLSGLHDEDSEFAIASAAQNQRNIFTEEKTKELKNPSYSEQNHRHRDNFREDRASQRIQHNSNQENTIERKGESSAKKSVTNNAQPNEKRNKDERVYKKRGNREENVSSLDMQEDQISQLKTPSARKKQSQKSSSLTSEEKVRRTKKRGKSPQEGKKVEREVEKRDKAKKNTERKKKQRNERKENDRKTTGSQPSQMRSNRHQSNTPQKKRTKQSENLRNPSFSPKEEISEQEISEQEISEQEISEQEISEQDISQFEDSYYDGPNKFDVSWNPPKKDSFKEKSKRTKRSSASKYQEEESSDDWTQSHIDKQPNIFQVITQTLLNPTQDPFYTIIVYGVLIIIILIMAIFAVDY